MSFRNKEVCVALRNVLCLHLSRKFHVIMEHMNNEQWSAVAPAAALVVDLHCCATAGVWRKLQISWWRMKKSCTFRPRKLTLKLSIQICIPFFF